MADKKEMTSAGAKALDFTNVKEGGGLFNKKRQPAGDYRAKVTKVVDSPAKKDGVDQWLFTIQVGTGTYPLYCKLVPDQLWKLRNLLMACGLNVPKARVKVNPQKAVGREIAVTLDDDEYDDGDKVHKQSQVTATFPLSELDGNAAENDEDEEEDDDDEEEEEVTPPTTKKKKAAPVVEDDDDDDDDDEEEPAPPPKKKKKAPEPEPEEDDDDEEEDDTPPPTKKKKKAAPVEDDDDDELDELDIDL